MSFIVNSDPSEKVLPRVPFAACLQAFMAEAAVEGRVTQTSLEMRLNSFPDFLIVQLKRFTNGPKWEPIKIGTVFWYFVHTFLVAAVPETCKTGS